MRMKTLEKSIKLLFILNIEGKNKQRKRKKHTDNTRMLITYSYFYPYSLLAGKITEF